MTDPALEREAIALFEQLLDIPADARVEWLATATVGRPPLLATRVAAMLAADQSWLRTGGAIQDAPEPAPPERLGGYRLLERIGHGGMGSVYRAERDRDDFAHVAAIKIIKPGLLSLQLLERFRRERQALAALSHPGIAQLFDGGETDDGAPFIVMELVDGIPLLDWIARHRPDRATRLGLFAQLCEAVATAHRSLIVHRDITPGNVLVTPAGRVKLIDFGIARVVAPAGPEDDPVAATSLASLSLTPGYAAPERMTAALVTTAIDVFSLGKVLGDLLDAYRDGEFDAIVAKATAEAATARYPSVAALAEDVARWSAEEPVTAFGASRRYAVRKFVSRHRRAVAAATIAAIVLIAATAITSWSYVRAERARVQAEARFAQTRSIANSLLTDVYDEVSKAPGSTMARVMLARTGLTYLDALARDPSAPPDVRAEAGRGFVRLAQVIGGGQQGQLGKLADSDALLARAAVILVPLHRAYPDRTDVARAYAALLIEQSGNNLYTNNAPAAGRAQARQAELLLAPTARQDATDARRYVVAIQAQGDSFGWEDRYDAAIPFHRRADDFIAALPPGLRGDPGVMAARAANLRLLAAAYHELKQDDAAFVATDKATAINEAMYAADRTNPTAIRNLAIALRQRTMLLRSVDRDAEAAVGIGRAVAVTRDWLTRSPDDVGALHMFAAVGEVEAETLADRRRYADSFVRTDEVVAAHRRMVALADDAPGALRSLGHALRSGGTNHYNGADYRGACRLWTDARGVFETLDERGALPPTDRTGALVEMRDLVHRGCEGGSARPVPGFSG